MTSVGRSSDHRPADSAALQHLPYHVMISRGDGAFAPRVTVVHQDGDDDAEADRDRDGEALLNG